MTVLKDVRILVADAIKAIKFLEGNTPMATGSYANGAKDVPAIQTEVITVTRDNVKAVIVDSGYYPASDFTGL